MKLKAVKTSPAVIAALILVLTSNPLHAQDVRVALSGSVTDSSGKALPNVQVSIKNLSNGESKQTQTDSTGRYNVPDLAPGDYEVSVSAEGIGNGVTKVTLTAESQPAANLVLMSPPVPGANPPDSGAATQQNLPDAPSSSQTQPSLEDLGFSKSEQRGNAQQQALLDKRTHMLKIHQRMGLITTIPMIASVVTSFNAGGRSEGTASRDLHVALGALTGDLYGITAYYAIRAPKVPGTETRGGIKVHKALAWVHGTGMILTPILGAIAFSQKNNGEKVHGIAQAHGPVAIVTAGAFGAALLSVSFKF